MQTLIYFKQHNHSQGSKVSWIDWLSALNSTIMTKSQLNFILFIDMYLQFCWKCVIYVLKGHTCIPPSYLIFLINFVHNNF